MSEKEFKNVVLKPRMVKIQRLEQALQYFKEKGHPSYQNIDIDEEYIPEFVFDVTEKDRVDENTREASQNVGQEHNEELENDVPENDESENEDDNLAAVRDHQSKKSEHYLMAGM